MTPGQQAALEIGLYILAGIVLLGAFIGLIALFGVIVVAITFFTLIGLSIGIPLIFMVIEWWEEKKTDIENDREYEKERDGHNHSW
jgi:predicted membrane channel-forming protein YqfA (hemolysin III family)